LEKKKNKIKLKDIAEIAGVSAGTVDRVIHGRGEVNKTTRDNVLRIIEELGYRPNLLARSLALKKTYRIIALLPTGSENINPYWELPKEGVVKAAAELADYNIEVGLKHFNAADRSSFVKQYKSILKEKPDGVVFSPVFTKQALAFSAACNTEDIPFILIDSNLEEANALGYYGQNTIQSGYLSAKLMSYGLTENATILVVNLTNTRSVTSHLRKRREGFLSKIRENEKAIKAINIDIDLVEKDEPAKSLKKMFSENPQIEGVFVTNSRVHKVAEFMCKNNNCNKLLVGYDLVDKNIEYLKKGDIDFLICQKPEEQGYKSVMALSNFILTKQVTPRVNYSQIDIITKENIEFYTNF
jgi:LacI family transcriptional regulator